MSVSLFLEFVKKYNPDIVPVKSDRPTTTAKEAAEAHGVPVSNIVKSLLIRESTGEFVIYLCPGDRRLNLKEGARMATAAEVKEVTGHSIGGVPPFGHKTSLKTVIVDGFDPQTPLWAAAGAANTNFETTLKDLKNIVKLLNTGGIFAVHKPKGPTSHDIINQLRRRTGIKKIGHAGTLDPLASGVLVVGIGQEATKKLSEIVKKEKEYVAKIGLGMVSTTDDEEGEKTETKNPKPPKPEEVQRVVAKFEGEILQTPPAYSAIKVKGQKAYKLARQGKVPKLEPRKVEIKEIEILKYEWPYLELRVVTGPGVYIRALARDIGQSLKTGGYLVELERTRVGNFTKPQALGVDEIYRNLVEYQ